MSEKAATYAAGSPASVHRSETRGMVCRTLRDAIHRSAHGFNCLKTLAAELDLAPSSLSAMTLLGEGDHVRPFPAERLAELCRVTGDHSPILTLAHELGYELRRPAEMKADAELLLQVARTLRGER